jgi:8-oxo-dGTP pyrophosphatase MutT (NUDIX family)
MSSNRVPVSVKGVVIEDGAVWLRKNERDEWELPGGKMDEGEQPDQTVVRELFEELGFRVRSTNIVDAYLYSIQVSSDESKSVLVLSYACELLEKTGEFELEGEAGRAEFKKFRMEELESLNMPEFYKRAIKFVV